MRVNTPCLTIAALLAGVSASSQAFGQDVTGSVALGGAGAIVGEPARELGVGPMGQATLGMSLSHRFALQVEGSALGLPSRGVAPSSPGVAARGDSYLVGGAFGVMARPFGARSDAFVSPGSIWIDWNLGAVDTGGRARPMADAHVGVDLRVARFAAIGPSLGLMYVQQPNGEPRPEDAVIGLVAVRITPQRAVIAPPWTPPDRDGDGIADARDACPDVPEDLDGFEDQDGCPELDNDKDGIADATDACPNLPEDKDGFEDEDGCPDPDNDKDGIADSKDACPNLPEDKDGFEDADGCPDPDNDKDGIADVVDRCPNEPETKNGYEDEDGCPDEVSVRVVGDEILLDERIHFDTDLATIRPVSFPILSRLAKLLRDHPEYERVTIEGHADESGSEAYNQRLSERRAASVAARLTADGVPPTRLASVGFGEARPRREGKSVDAWRANRRVEFRVMRRQVVADEARHSVAGTR